MRFARRRALVTAIALLTTGLALPAHALADADPASDYLPSARVFYPYQPAVSSALRERLEGTLARLQAKGMNLKVAVILNPYDLGAVHVLFGRPQLYAKLLEYEISFGHPQPLLVVMPAGFGTSHVGPSSALRGVAIDNTHQTDGLVHSAILAVFALAAANGISISPTRDSGGGLSPVIAVGVPLLLLILIGAAALGLRRRARRPAGLRS